MADEALAQGEPKKKKGFLKWIIILVLLLGLAGGGYFAYMKYFAKAPEEGATTEEPAGEEEAAEAEGEEGAGAFKDLVQLPTFVVNLADPLGRRYLKLTMEVEVADEATSLKLGQLEPKVRDAIIMLLSSKSYQDLSSMESKLLLKKEIVSRLNQVLGGKPKVLQVFFTDMVIQ